MPISPELQTFTTAPQSLINYNYRDLFNKTGFVIYYLAITNIDRGEGDVVEYILTEHQVEGHQSTSGFGMTGSTTYDGSPLPQAATLKGIATFSGQIKYGSGTDAISCSLWHVTSDGVTETQIGETVSGTTNSSGRPFNLAVEVEETRFAVGEYFRLKVTASGNYYSADPSEIRPDTNSSKLRIPFKLDI